MITCGPELVDISVDELRVCSDGSRECVVYWLASTTVPSAVAEVVHPDHTSGRLGYSVDDRWLTQFFFDLADRRLTAVAQIHTHPGSFVEHSQTDDEFALVPSAGFVSIVVPDFARGFERSRCGIHVLEESGRWRRSPYSVSW